MRRRRLGRLRLRMWNFRGEDWGLGVFFFFFCFCCWVEGWRVGEGMLAFIQLLHRGREEVACVHAAGLLIFQVFYSGPIVRVSSEVMDLLVFQCMGTKCVQPMWCLLLSHITSIKPCQACNLPKRVLRSALRHLYRKRCPRWEGYEVVRHKFRVTLNVNALRGTGHSCNYHNRQ